MEPEKLLFVWNILRAYRLSSGEIRDGRKYLKLSRPEGGIYEFVKETNKSKEYGLEKFWADLINKDAFNEVIFQFIKTDDNNEKKVLEEAVSKEIQKQDPLYIMVR